MESPLLTTTANGSETTSESFRRYLPDLDTPRFAKAKLQNAHEYAEDFKIHHQPEPLFRLTKLWEELLIEPFKGVTSDGEVKEGLFRLEDGGIESAAICQAVEGVLGNASPKEKLNLHYPITAREWRCWSNPEFLLRPFGLRLDEIREELALLILRVVEVTLSTEGYQKALGAMRINHFLGEMCELPRIMNKYSYNFLLFGSPSTTEAWGWSLYGHHLCLNVFLKGSHISITPTFTGAEPNEIDCGEFKGTKILHREGELGLQLMQSLPDDLQEQAQIYEALFDARMLLGYLKIDRWNDDDQRHVCGAFRDNRVVPDEGVLISSFDPNQRQKLLEIVEQFIIYLPQRARQQRLQEVERYFERTCFSWIGRFGKNDPYYFRIQSPVIICEFDHHSGVFLTNEEPAKFHIHTIVRTPNGGDYANALRKTDERLE